MVILKSTLKLLFTIFLNLYVNTSFADLQTKLRIFDLKKVGSTVEINSLESFDSFNYFVGKIEGSHEIILWKTLPESYNCHFYSMMPFFNFGGGKYWLDSTPDSPLNQGLDSFDTFLESYFKRIAFSQVDDKNIYTLVPSLEKTDNLSKVLREDDVFVLQNGFGEKTHSGRFHSFDDSGDILITSKLGGGPVKLLTIDQLLNIEDYRQTYFIKIYRIDESKLPAFE